MTVTNTTQWRVRVGSTSANNGGGFDPSVSSPGTNYATQDDAQVIYTDLVIGASNTVTSVANPFSSVHSGNVLCITGGTGFTAGRYVITSVSGSTATLSSSPGTNGSTGGAGRLGGAVTIAGSYGSDSTIPAFVRHLLAGNRIYILGVAGNAASYPTSSLDYATTGYMGQPNGDTTNGPIRWMADPAGPMPTLSTNGLWTFSATDQLYEGLYLVATSNNNGIYGAIYGNVNTIVTSCVLNLNNQASQIGISVSTGSAILDCEVYGGTTTPTASSGSDLVVLRFPPCMVSGCYLHHGRDNGISGVGSGAALITENIIYGCVGNGITATDANFASGQILGNTIDANKGHGISVTTTSLVQTLVIYNNLLTNHNQSGKAGLSVAGTQTTNDLIKRFVDYNWFYNNTVSQSSAGISLGAHSTEGTDPVYTNVSGRDWTPTAAGVQSGFVYPHRGAVS